MPKSLLKIIGISLIILSISVSCKCKDQPNFALAKRSLLEREREFMRNRPISEDLRSFIARYRRKSRDKRAKRSQGIDENLLYVVQNGQLVPFKNMKGYMKRSDEDRRSEENSFTVVPLVIPLNPKGQEPKLVKTRTLNEELQSMQKDDKPAPPLTTAKPEPVAESNPESLDDDENTNGTKEETQVLHKILEDVEGLMQWKHEGNKKEGILCNLNGSWISEAAGMRFDICYRNSTRKKFRIHLADRIPPNEDGFLCDGNWTVFGELPFIHSGVVLALAVHQKDKHIATFIGECRICEGSETVTGTWLLGRSSRDCKDQKAAHKVLSDVWRREQTHSLRKKHLQQLGLNVNEED